MCEELYSFLEVTLFRYRITSKCWYLYSSQGNAFSVTTIVNAFIYLQKTGLTIADFSLEVFCAGILSVLSINCVCKYEKPQKVRRSYDLN